MMNTEKLVRVMIDLIRVRGGSLTEDAWGKIYPVCGLCLVGINHPL